MIHSVLEEMFSILNLADLSCLLPISQLLVHLYLLNCVTDLFYEVCRFSISDCKFSTTLLFDQFLLLFEPLGIICVPPDGKVLLAAPGDSWLSWFGSEEDTSRISQGGDALLGIGGSLSLNQVTTALG